MCTEFTGCVASVACKATPELIGSSFLLDPRSRNKTIHHQSPPPLDSAITVAAAATAAAGVRAVRAFSSNDLVESTN